MPRLKSLRLSAEQWLLLLIMAVAIALRFWRWFEIPLTYDEYSSLFRMSDEGEFGDLSFWSRVRLDAHPGLHHGIVRILGDTPNALLKLPFLLAGSASVYLTFLAGKRWFSVTTGLLAAAALAVIQPAVMHSQIARPYALGLLFCTAALVSLHGVKNGKRASILWSGVWVALAMYSHYFAGLTAGLALICVAFTSTGNWKGFALAAGFGAVLFLPHISITLAQLKHGDLGTVVAEPSWDWIFQHLAYNAHYSWFFGLILLAVGFYFLWRSDRKLSLERAAFKLVWFLPFLLGFVYSVVVGPILQHRILLFGLPCLLIAVFATTRGGKKEGAVGVLLLLLTGSFSLVQTRKHYRAFYEREYNEVFSALVNPEQPDHAVRLLSYHRSIAWQAQLHHLDGGHYEDWPFNSLFIDSTTTLLTIRRMIDTSTAPVAFMGVTGHYDRPPPEALGMLLEKYPRIDASKGYHNGHWWWLSKNPQSRAVVAHLTETDWDFTAGYEYGKPVSIPLSPDDLPGWMFFHVHVEHSSGCSARLVCEVKREGERLLYRSQRVDAFSREGESGTTVHLGLFLEDLRGLQPDEVFIYWHNPNGDTFTAGDLINRALPHNKWQYSLTEPIEE